MALELLMTAYWPAVYKYLRLRWNRDAESAADLTQSFFLIALEKDYFSSYEPEKARFRTFIRLCLDRYVAKADRDASRLKRGGGSEHLSLDFEGIEAEVSRDAGGSTSPEEFFEREWIRTLLSTSLEQLREQTKESGKQLQFRIFEQYDLVQEESRERPSYRALADEHNLRVETVTNYLAAMRRSLRAIVLTRLREMTASDEEFRAEARVVLGVDPE